MYYFDDFAQIAPCLIISFLKWSYEYVADTASWVLPAQKLLIMFVQKLPMAFWDS